MFVVLVIQHEKPLLYAVLFVTSGPSDYIIFFHIIS